jgi:hypothetical protein
VERQFLNAAIMAKLCAIAKVTDPELFSCCIHDLVERIWVLDRVAYAAQHASDLTTSPKRIAQAARALDEALRQSSEEAKLVVRIQLPSPRPKSLDPLHIAVTDLATAAGSVKGPVQNPWIATKRFFIGQLISDAEISGGKLTYYGETSSLMQVLNCLKPHLPVAFHFSFTTARRIVRGAKKHPIGRKTQKNDL